MGFYSKLTAQMEHVMLYEDPNLQTKARRCIPMEELDRKAQSKLDDIKVFFFLNWYSLLVTCKAFASTPLDGHLGIKTHCLWSW